MELMTEEKKKLKRTKIGLIPEDWELTSMGNICWVNQGLQIPIEKRLKTPTPKSKKYITIQFLGNRKDIEYISDYSKSVTCSEDDILMTRTGNTGIVVTNVEGVFHNNFFKINHNKNKVHKDFLVYYLSDNKTQKRILEKAGTSTIPDLNHSDFYSLSVPLPSLSEQQAIASALSDVDELICSLDELIQKKEAIKKGTMQQLLTGKKRLPGFDGVWEVKKLGQLLLSSPDYGINAPAVDYNSNYPTYLRITDISENGRFIKSDKKSVKAVNSDMYYLNKGEIVLARTGASTGKSYHYDPNDGELVFAGFLIRIKPNPEKLFSHFLKYFLQTDKYWNWVKTNSMRSGQPGLNSVQYSSLEILIPPLVEQKAIAQILSDMDRELQTLHQKREKYVQIKQGMMQELLTGRVRLM